MTNQPHLIPDETTQPGPVTCLGLTFENDDARRAHFTELLRQKLLEPAFRAIEGFPIGTDEAILALSDPPYYTACPNPWLGEMIAEWAEIRNYELRITNEEESSDIRNSSFVIRNYHREPFAADVSEGKNDPIYNAHSYHTKVPHKAIMRYILHYTDPGDVVFDGFCGTGMTGVAAQLCGDRQAVEGLGYRVDGEGVVYDGDRAISRLGARRAVLNDLSPAATFIAYNYNTPVDVAAFEREARRILKEVEEELGWMYETWHPHCDDPKRVKGKINYTVWSDVFVCPQCANEVVFWEAAVDKQAGKVRDEFPCPYCGAALTKRGMERAWVTKFDKAIDQTIRQAKQVPVLINYSVGKKRFNKELDAFDLNLIGRAEESEIVYWVPTYSMMHVEPGIPWGDEWRPGRAFTHIHHLIFSRSNLVLSNFRQKALTLDKAFRHLALLALTAILQNSSRMYRWRENGKGGTISGTFYLSSTPQENNVLDQLHSKIQYFSGALYVYSKKGTLLSTQSLTADRNINSFVDYIFLDPPFGANLAYSELNFLWESWLNVWTNNKHEAIENKTQGKGLREYRHLMVLCFKEAYRALKPGSWMTVEFSNTKASVWNSIQAALTEAGFIVGDVSELDKMQGSFKAVTTHTAVKQDLVISAYKPNGGFEERFAAVAESAEGVWEFVRSHLSYLPVVKEGDTGIQRVAERDPRILFDQVVAYYVRRGYPVPLSSQEFQQGMARRFDERDGMFFLKEQVPGYEAARLRAGRPSQLTLFVSDEKSSLAWLRQQLDPALGGRPQTYQDIQPAFLRSLHQAAHEALPELRELLRDNFLPDEDGRWHAPDPNKAEDLERLRRRALLAEFESYLSGRGRLKQFRAEAVRAGFAEAYRNKKFDDILRVAARLPERVVQEDPDLLMYYDTASLRT